MEYSIKKFGDPEKQRSGCLIAGFYEKHKLTASATALNDATGGLIAKLLKRENLTGKAGDSLTLNHMPEIAADRVILVGLGQKGKLSTKNYRTALSAAIKALKKTNAKSALSTLTEVEVTGQDLAWKTAQTVQSFEDVLYEFKRLKTGPDKPRELTKIQIAVGSKEREEAETGIQRGIATATGVALAKELANLPGNICTPSYLAEQAQQLAKEHKKLKATILEEADMEALGMGALLSVSRGSRQPAKLIVLEYKGADADQPPQILVGKGLTFDAGGISLKPAEAMDEMKYDMCGGASVLGALSAVATLQLPLNVIGIIPSSENLPDGNANKPGDIVTSMSGKTIEILNTDAEGRLILCDALTYAERYKPAAVIDIATLTGACIIALGRQPSGLMGNDDDLCQALTQAGETAGDRVWRLPLWEEYQDQLKTKFADMANIGGRDAGSITAGCFLARYTEAYKWAHLDIAGTAWKTGANKAATGRPVPLLVQYLLDQVS